MPITLVSHVTAAARNAFTSGAIDTSGATLLAMLLSVADVTDAVPSDSKGNTWVELTPQNSSGIVTSVIYYVVNPTVGTGHTFTLTNSVHAMTAVMEVAAWSGVATTTPFDQQSGANGAPTSTIQPGSKTPGAAGALIVSQFSWDRTEGTVSVDSGLAILDQTDFSSGTNQGAAAAYLVQTSAAAINPQWTFTGGIANVAVTMAIFLPGGGGTPGDAQDWFGRTFYIQKTQSNVAY